MREIRLSQGKVALNSKAPMPTTLLQENCLANSL